ncbi:MAG: hypothetical protein ACFE8A_02450 [Candidatus Hodarchaeota archaeon]
MSSIEITKEKIIITKREMDGEILGLIFNKDELSEIIIYQNMVNLLKLQIAEKTRIKIETIEKVAFRKHSKKNDSLLLEIRQELTP